MPAKVSLNVRPMVMAGLAKLVEEVNQYAAPMNAPHSRWGALATAGPDQ